MRFSESKMQRWLLGAYVKIHDQVRYLGLVCANTRSNVCAAMAQNLQRLCIQRKVSDTCHGIKMRALCTRKEIRTVLK
jgi:hypothetical protein